MAEQTTQGQETALDDDCGEYDEPNLTAEEFLDLALDNAQTCVENGSLDGWARAYLRDVERLRTERDSWARRFASVEEELNEKTTEALSIVQEAQSADDECAAYSIGYGVLSVALRKIKRVLAGPSSVADYEALGTPVEDKQ